MGVWNRRDFLKGGGVLAGSALFPSELFAASTWPGQPITAFIATALGGGVDQVMRALAPILEPKLHDATINVINKTGATGSIAGTYVLQQPADGYSWFCAGSFNRGLRAMDLMNAVPYETWQYYGADTSLASLSVLPDSPIKDMADLLNKAKAAPGKIRVSTNGPGGTWHLAAVLIMQQSGTKFRIVPYNGGKPAMVACLKGEVDVALDGLHEQFENIRAGKLRNLCVAVDKPLAFRGVHLRPITEYIHGLAGKTPIGGGVAMAMRRDTDPAILREVAKAWVSSVNSKQFRELEAKKPRFPDPVIGEAADKRATLWECIAANLLWDTHLAKKSPKELGLPTVNEFEKWWPPKGYKPRI